MQEIATWFRSLYETTGLNFTIFYDPYDATQFARGVGMTIYLSVVSILISLVVGGMGAWLQSSRIGIVRGVVEIFVVIFRNTPPLVQIFFFYFGMGELLPATYKTTSVCANRFLATCSGRSFPFPCLPAPSTSKS